MRRGAKRLATTPEEIAEHTGIDVGTVRKWLSRATRRRVEGKVVVVRVGRTDVILMLTPAVEAKP